MSIDNIYFMFRSTRQMNRLRQSEMNIQDPPPLGSSSEEDDDDDDEPPVRRFQRVWSMSSSSSEEEIEEKEEIEIKPKKNKKKKNEKTKDFQDHAFLDAIVAQQTQENSTTTHNSTMDYSLYSWNANACHAEKEMKKSMGIQNSNMTTSSSKKQSSFANQKGKHMRSFRKTRFVYGLINEAPPPTFAGGGLRMNVSLQSTRTLGWDYDVLFFELEASDHYQEATRLMQTVQSTHDPQQLSRVLRKAPYHIETCCILSSFYEQHGQMDEATRWIQRAILALEYTFLDDKFTPWNGQCRMDINGGCNIILYTSFYRHVLYSGKRLCWQSAFHTAKFLWSLDPRGDPMSLLLLLDYYAISSRNYTFLVELSASNLPLVAISDDQETVDKKKASASSSSGGIVQSRPSWQDITVLDFPHVVFGAAFSLYWLGKREEATVQLQLALVKFPQVLAMLVKDGILSLDLPARWQYPPSVDEVTEHLLTLWTSRTGPCWKDQQMTEWIFAVLVQMDTENVPFVITPKDISHPIWNKYMDISMNDIMGEIQRLPEEDPRQLQLVEAQRIRQMEHMQHLEQIAEMENNNNVDVVNEEAFDLQETHPALLFLQSLMPWNNIPNTGSAQNRNAQNDG